MADRCRRAAARQRPRPVPATLLAPLSQKLMKGFFFVGRRDIKISWLASVDAPAAFIASFGQIAFVPSNGDPRIGAFLQDRRVV